MDADDREVDGKHVDVDRMLRSLNDVGKFQIQQNSILSLNILCQGMNILSIVFIGFIPAYQCRPYANSSAEWPEELHQMIPSNQSNVTLKYGECHVTVLTDGKPLTNQTFPCTNGYLYSRSAELSFITEWDLVCDRAAIGALSQSLLTIGMGIGAALIPNFVDKYGRKPVLIICMLGLWASSLALGFSPSHNVFMAFRFLVGFFQQGLHVANILLSLELFPKERRAFITMLCNMGWSVGSTIMTPLAYGLRNQRWRNLAIVISCSTAFVILDICFIEESLRWLFAKNRVSQAKQIVRRAAKINGVDFNEIWQNCVTKSSVELETMSDKNHLTTTAAAPQQQTQQQQQFVDENNEKNDFFLPTPTLLSTIDNTDRKHDLIASESLVPAKLASMKKASMCFKSKKTESALNLLTNRILRFIMAIQIFTWFISTLTYYGIYLMSSSLAGNRFLNFFITVQMELLSMALMWKMFVWVGRKKTIVIFLSICIISFVTSTIGDIFIDKTSKYAITSTVCAIAGMFGICGSFSGLWGYLPELIPTKYRGAALGIASSAGRFGSALAPFTAFLVRYYPWGPGVIFSAGCLVANFLIMMLPETRGRQLPQNIDEVKTWMKKSPKNPVKDSTNYSKISQQNDV